MTSIFFFLPYYSGLDFTTILNKSGENGHPCLVSVLRGNAFILILLSMILTVGFSYMTFIILKYITSNFFENFYYKWILNAFRCFSASIEIIMTFIFHSIKVVYQIYWLFCILYHPWIPRIKPSCSWYVILLIFLFNLIC